MIPGVVRATVARPRCVVCRRTNGLGRGRAHSDSLRRARVNLLGSDKSRGEGGQDDNGGLSLRATHRVCW